MEALVMQAHRQLGKIGAALRESSTLYRLALSERNVALLLGAGFASEIGDWFNIVALISLSYHFSDGAAGVGGMLAIRMLTRLLCQGPAGALVDRHPGRMTLFASQVAMAFIATAFMLLVYVPELWLLYLLVILLEAANCVARPAFMVELRLEAPEALRPAANGALYASSTTAQLIGPLLGALALAPLGPEAVFALNGVTFLAVAAAVALLRGGLRGRAAAEPALPEHEQVAGATGYRWLLQRPDLALYALVSLSLALLAQATIALFVVHANALGLGDGGVGIFYAAVAFGSVAGSVIAGASAQYTAPLYPAAVAMAVCAVALAAFGSASAALAAIGILTIAGFATDFYEVVGLTYFQHAIPQGVYGRFFSVFLLALSAGGLIGALAGPALEQALGVAGALAALAAPAIALSALFVVMTKRWQFAERQTAT
jgi:MFS family permease